MINQYTIYDILVSEKEKKPYYFGTFEDIKDPEIEWPHLHDYSSFIYFTHGKGANIIDDKEYEIKSDRFFIIIPGQIHNWSYSEHTKGYILLLDKFFYHIENNQTPFVDVPEKYQILIKSIFQNQINEYKKRDEIAEFSVPNVIHYLNNIIARIVKETHFHMISSSSKLTKFLKLINENLSENLSVEAFADKLNISVDKLNNLCKTSMQVTAKQLIIDQKITAAKRMLYYSTLSVKEIAYKQGFEDSSYFSRLFRNKTGCTPNEFREKVPEIHKKVL